METPIFKLIDITKAFEANQTGRTVAVDHVTLTIGKNAFVGIVGTSGAGKSTLLRLLNLLESPTSGKIEFKGADIAAFSKRERIDYLSKVSTIFQHFNLFHGMTVLENIAFPLSIRGVSAQERRRRSLDLIKSVGLEGKENHYPSQLSGGQKQRVGIARALITQPEVLLCDEATSALDSQTTDSILELLAMLQARHGFTVVMITHSWEVVRKACDTVVLIEHGQIREQGHIADIIERPSSRLKDHLLPLDDTSPANAGAPSSLATLDLLFKTPGQQTGQLTHIANALNASVSIMAGRVESIGGNAIARFRIKVSAQDHALAVDMDEFKRRLRQAGIHAGSTEAQATP